MTMLQQVTSADDNNELRARVERQRVVISTQSEILESLGFDMVDFADCPERLQPPDGRLRLVLAGWVVPGPLSLVLIAMLASAKFAGGVDHVAAAFSALL